MKTRCNNCFKIFNRDLDMCPHCGYEAGDPATEPYFLCPGMILNNRYMVGEVLGFGGFGITYKAWDKNLDTIVAIKEYYYTGIANRVPGTYTVMIYAQNRRDEFQHFLKRFLDEARYTAKFSKNGNIVNVYEFFEANNTAYMVMEYLEGTPLNEYLKKSSMDTTQCVAVMKSLSSALKAVHAAGVIHRDISPDNIMLSSDGKVKLFDFGAARFSKHEEQTVMKLTQVMKPGFSPPEQYQTVSKQGPWTDIYALGATLYYMITGVKPEESTNRKTEDNLTPPKDIKPDIPEYINDTILRAMAVDTHIRFSSVDEFERALSKEKKVLNVKREKRRRRKNRVLGILAAVMALLGGFSIFAYVFNEQRLAETLPDGEIEFWYVVPVNGEAKTDALESIVEVFNTSYPNVSIELVQYTSDEYLIAISDAYDDDNLPPIFESTGLEDVFVADFHSVSLAVKAVDPTSVLFWDNYETVFPDEKHFPLGFTMPVKYINIAPDIDVVNEGSTRKQFLAGNAHEFVGSTADYFMVQQALPARYEIEQVNDDDIVCEFNNLLSVGNCDKDQLAIVNRFLVFLLTENAQDHLHIQYQSGSLPLNRKALLDGYVSVYDEFDGFFDGIDRFKITEPILENEITVDSDEEVDDFVEEVDEYTDESLFSTNIVDDQIVIMGYLGNDEVVAIPPTIDDKQVVSIDNAAFAYKEGIREITLPDTVETIVAYAFYGCINLEVMHFSENLAYIGKYAFWDCRNLNNLVIPDGVTYIGECAFGECHALTDVYIPQGIEFIGAFAFTKDYIIPTSNVRILYDEDIADLVEIEVYYASEEIYARHGCMFDDQDVQGYFDAKSWYMNLEKKERQDISLSRIEWSNWELLNDYIEVLR